MQNNIGPKRHVLLHLYQKVQSLFSPVEAVHKQVREVLKKCKNMHDLLDFLFSTDLRRDGALLSLFQQRIDELDASTSQSFFTH
jgi:hypothetical protein